MTTLRLLHSWLRANDPGAIALLDPEAELLVVDKAVPAVVLTGPLADVPKHEILEAFTLGATEIYLHGDHGAHRDLVTLLGATGLDILKPARGTVKPKTSFLSDDVPHSRRDLFGLNRSEVELPDESMLPQDRERRALRTLLEAHDIELSVLADSPSHALLLHTSGCTACGVCVKACPTDALELTHLETGPDKRISTLSEYDSRCIGCQDCVALCPVDAFSVGGAVSWEVRLGEGTRRPLETIPTTRCERCKTFYPMREGGTLCKTCKATRENPFGIRWPEGVPKPPGVNF